MDENTICNIPFKGEKEKWRMWLLKLTARDGIKGYHFLLTGDNKIPADDAEETQENKFLRLSYSNLEPTLS